MDESNLKENSKEVLPQTSVHDLTKPIDPDKKSKKELDKLARLRLIEKKKYHARRIQKTLAKASKKKNRKKR